MIYDDYTKYKTWKIITAYSCEQGWLGWLREQGAEIHESEYSLDKGALIKLVIARYEDKCCCPQGNFDHVFCIKNKYPVYFLQNNDTEYKMEAQEEFDMTTIVVEEDKSKSIIHLGKYDLYQKNTDNKSWSKLDVHDISITVGDPHFGVTLEYRTRKTINE